MIIQPYIENAIWHGLTNKEGKGQLTLRFDRENGSIRCTVEDNGIGRKKAAEIAGQSSIRRKSYGMDISKKRLELLRKENEYVPEVRVENLFSEGARDPGTKVTLFFHID